MACTKDTEALAQFSAGNAVRAQEYMGAHPAVRDGQAGWVFRVWAPHARKVAVMGDFNGWSEEANPMEPLDGGVWEAFLPGLQQRLHGAGPLFRVHRAGAGRVALAHFGVKVRQVQFVDVPRRTAGGCKQVERVIAYRNCQLQATALSRGPSVIVLQILSRRHPESRLVRTFELHAVEGSVPHTGVGVLSNDHPGSYVASGILGVVLYERELPYVHLVMG